MLIVGAGWVGRQIAARFAQYGVRVCLCDRTLEDAAAAVAWVEQTCSEVTGLVHAAPPIAQWTSASCEMASCEMAGSAPTAFTPDLVLESVSEELSLKKRLLKQLSSRFAPPIVIASNSSYFVPSLLGRFVAHPERFAHLHFHVPVLSDSVADIVGCAETEPQVLERLRQLCQRVQQSPLMLRREHPGYIFNWMLQSLLQSALELAALDVADIADIDRSWKSVTGMSVGPFGMMDRIGLDVIEQVLSNARWAEPSSVDSTQLMQLVQQHTRAGRLGTKTQAGFYNYADKSVTAAESTPSTDIEPPS